jgi:hypothetical protein
LNINNLLSLTPIITTVLLTRITRHVPHSNPLFTSLSSPTRAHFSASHLSLSVSFRLSSAQLGRSALIKLGVSWHSNTRPEPQAEHLDTDDASYTRLTAGTTLNAAFVTGRGSWRGIGHSRSNVLSEAKGSGVPCNSYLSILSVC